MKIIVENSTWNNLGDGFYQFSLYKLLKNIYPKAEVYFGEGPVERTFRPNKKQLNNALKIIEFQNADLHVFSGPMLPTLTRSDYKNTIKNIINSGKQYALISISCAGLEGSMLNEVREFLLKYPPIVFSSRDQYTYEMFKDYVPSSYNGICTAFLVNKLLKLDTVHLDKKYFISSFYTKPEPEYIVKGEPTINNINYKEKNKLISGFSWRINKHLEFFRNVPDEIGGLKIVRTVQGVSNKSNYFNFKYRNTFITLNPLNLLSVFKGAEFTISERVHACAVTLAFGKPARIIIDSPRCGIFDRLGLLDYKNNGGFLYPDNLDQRIENELELLSEYLLNSIKI